MAKIGLVTVLFKSDELLPDFFKSISAQTHKDYILYLVDNSPATSTEKMIARCVTEFPVSKYKHMTSPGNIGVAAGNNVGIRQALADGCTHILLLNNDIEFDQEHMFSTMLTLSEREPIVVNKIFYYDTRRVWMAGGYMDTWRALGVHYGYDKPDSPQYNIAKHVTYSPTCFMLVQKEVFEKIGFMDEKYFAYYDDTDFVLRATRAGFKLYYEPALTILHKVSSSAGTNSPFYVYYSNRNKIYFIRKNLVGIKRYFSICYLFLSRVIFYLRFDKTRRQKLVQGLKDGFKMEIDQIG